MLILLYLIIMLGIFLSGILTLDKVRGNHYDVNITR